LISREERLRIVVYAVLESWILKELNTNIEKVSVEYFSLFQPWKASSSQGLYKEYTGTGSAHNNA
jgi:hypothetical protein